MKTTCLLGFPILPSSLVLAWLFLGCGPSGAQMCYYEAAADMSGTMSPNFSIFPPGSYLFRGNPEHPPGYYYETAVVPGMGFSIQMLCDTDDGASGPAVYQLQAAFENDMAPYSHDIVHALTVSPGSRLDRSTTTACQGPPYVWQTACFVTNAPGVLHPTVTFIYQSGTVSSSSWVIAESFRFIKIIAPPSPPRLNIACCGTNLALSWTTNSAGYGLYQCTELAARNWVVVTNAPIVTNGLKQVLLSPAHAGCRFFRLKY